MGRYDSTQTRVAPVFDILFARDPSGASWLAPLLGLPRRPDGANASRPITPPLQMWGWGAHECRLSPPRRLLHWLVDHVIAPADKPPTNRARSLAGQRIPGSVREGAVGRDTGARARLLAGDPATRQLAHARIDAGPAHRAWYVLEGRSQPDVVLATRDAVVVIEGKRTESGPTVRTKWLPGRDQMLRHLDAAFEIAANRRLYGFYIVESLGGDTEVVPKHWREAARVVNESKTVAEALPHRTAAEREVIAAAYLGVTTWQAVCAALDVVYADLPDEVLAVPATTSVPHGAHHPGSGRRT